MSDSLPDRRLATITTIPSSTNYVVLNSHIYNLIHSIMMHFIKFEPTKTFAYDHLLNCWSFYPDPNTNICSYATEISATSKYDEKPRCLRLWYGAGGLIQDLVTFCKIMAFIMHLIGYERNHKMTQIFVKYILQSMYFSSFEAGNCVSNSSFK